MLGVALFAIGVLGVLKNSNAIERIIPTAGTLLQNREIRLPMIFEDDRLEKSFAGQIHNDVRAPFGPDRKVRDIDDTSYFDSNTYRMKRRQHLTDMTVENQDWRLDPTTNSDLNNTNGSWHTNEPEAVRSISKYWNQNFCKQRQKINCEIPTASIGDLE